MIGRITIVIDTDDWTDGEGDEKFDESKYKKEQLEQMIIDELVDELHEVSKNIEGYVEFEDGTFSRYNIMKPSDDKYEIIINTDSRYNEENDIEGEPKGIAGDLGATLTLILNNKLKDTAHIVTYNSGQNTNGTLELIKNKSRYTDDDLHNLIDEAYFEVLQYTVGDQK